MSPTFCQFLISHYRWPLLLGVFSFIASRWFDGFGIITGFMAIWLGSAAGCFHRWREEPGLWMLSALILAMCSTFYAFMTWGRIMDIRRQGQVPFPWSLNVDIVMATLILAVLIRFLATVTYSNWKLTQSGHQA